MVVLTMYMSIKEVRRRGPQAHRTELKIKSHPRVGQEVHRPRVDQIFYRLLSTLLLCCCCKFTRERRNVS